MKCLHDLVLGKYFLKTYKRTNRKGNFLKNQTIKIKNTSSSKDSIERQATKKVSSIFVSGKEYTSRKHKELHKSIEYRQPNLPESKNVHNDTDTILLQ